MPRVGTISGHKSAKSTLYKAWNNIGRLSVSPFKFHLSFHGKQSLSFLKQINCSIYNSLSSNRAINEFETDMLNKNRDDRL